MATNMPNGRPDRRLDFTNIESTLRRLLIDVAQYTNPKKPSELRFTGGWVRDKLLGVGSHDIDVSINDMTGLQFGLKMKEYLELPGNPEKYHLQGVAKDDANSGDKGTVVTGLHKIEANPEKSKHLETITTKVFGLDIDLVNLRKETYSEDSRNPQMEFGTPEEDALRRDATINAMFYNLQTEMIEDFTGRGFDDMRDKIIRTPLEPFQTFKDDPLRVLRLIRFASRLGYCIDEASEVSMMDETIKQALKAKISRERIGVEFEKMLKGPDPRMALTLIDRLGLYKIIFADPTVESTYDPEVELWQPSYNFAAALMAGQSSQTLREILLPDNDHEYIAWILSCFTPWIDAPEALPNKSGKLASSEGVLVAREGIKATNKISDIVQLALRNSGEIVALKDRLIQRQKSPQKSLDGDDPCARDTLGMAIRRWGPTWRSQAVFAIMLEVARSTKDASVLTYAWEIFLNHLKSLSLLTAYDFKPVIDGRTLAKALDTRPGPWMKDALDVVMAWQLLNPSTATTSGAIEAVKNKQGELTAVLVRHFLQLTIRPLFAKTQTHEHVTKEGRKVENKRSAPRRYDGIEVDEEEKKLWKKPEEAPALELLKWVLKSLNYTLTERNWPSLVPPILTLLDDTDVVYKAKGCEFLHALLDSTPPALLARTGLGELFETAIGPSLTYLPTLTPQSESNLILNAAYPALLTLGRVRFPSSRSSSPLMPEPNDHERVRFLATILHAHILPSISHLSRSHPLLVVLLLTQLSHTLDALALDTVAQLVHILPLLTTLMTTPFAAAEPALLAEAARTMQVVLRNAWPRAWYWRGECLRALCGGWIELMEEEGRKSEMEGAIGRQKVVEVVEEERPKLEDDTFGEAKKAMVRMVEMLLYAVEAMMDAPVTEDSDAGVIDFRKELEELLEADERLAGLLDKVLARRPGT